MPVLLLLLLLLQVFCNGVEVMTVGGTKQQYNVDIYSGNHPFYQVRGGAVPRQFRNAQLPWQGVLQAAAVVLGCIHQPNQDAPA
jgi:hypothetical protein